MKRNNEICRNKFKFKVESILKLVLDCFDIWVIVKVLNFFSAI